MIIVKAIYFSVVKILYKPPALIKGPEDYCSLYVVKRDRILEHISFYITVLTPKNKFFN